MELTRDELDKVLDKFEASWLTETLAFLKTFSTYVDMKQGEGIQQFGSSDGVPLENLTASGLKIEGVRHAIYILKTIHDLQENAPTSVGLLAVRMVSPKIKGNLVFGLFSPQMSLLEEVLDKREKERLKQVSMRAISMNNDGNYVYGGTVIPFNKRSIYFYVFECLYKRSGVVVPYDEIDAYLARNGKHRRYDPVPQSQRIRNAVKTYERNEYFPKMIGNQSVFEIKKDNGVIFHNPISN